MESPQIEKIEDLVPVVRKYLVPSIETAVMCLSTLTRPIPITTTTLLEPTSGKTPGTGSMQLPLPVKRRSNYTERPMSTRSGLVASFFATIELVERICYQVQRNQQRMQRYSLTFSVPLSPPYYPARILFSQLKLSRGKVSETFLLEI